MDKIRENVPLGPLTTLGIGGPARFFADAESLDDVLAALEFAASKDIDVFILGGGSNILISDDGVDGLIVRIGLGGLEFMEAPDRRTRVAAGAGVDWDHLVHECIRRGLAGLECLSGIPGSVGGTPIQNVGAYGQEVSDSIVAVTCIDRMSGQMVELNTAQCDFSYRSSIFNTIHRCRYIVLNVTYSLQEGSEPKIVYKDLAEFFDGRTPALSEVRDAVLTIRRAKSMVIDPSDPNSRSAGSFFKNPVVDWPVFDNLRGTFGQIPSFAVGDKVKIPAAWLIENAGFYKGFVMGNVGLSENHTLAIINRRGGTAAEVMELKARIQDAVFAKFGIELIPEPILAGFVNSN